MVRHKCSKCPCAMLGLSSSFCWHKENYCELLTPYQISTDAGYSCPLNISQPDYIPLKKEQELREKGQWKLFCERSNLSHLLTEADYEETDGKSDAEKLLENLQDSINTLVETTTL